MNLRSTILKNTEFRRDLKSLLQTKIYKEYKNGTFLSPLYSYFPKGVLPNSYYKSKPQVELDVTSFIQKWEKHQSYKTLKVILVKDWLDEESLKILINTFEDIGVSNVVLVSKNEFIEHLKSKDYDIISGAYLGTFPEPEGFLDPLKLDSKARLGSFPTEDFFKNITSFSNGYEENLKKIELEMIKLEDKSYFIPLFQLSMPIIYHKKLKLADTQFRFENELWKLLWNHD